MQRKRNRRREPRQRDKEELSVYQKIGLITGLFGFLYRICFVLESEQLVPANLLIAPFLGMRDIAMLLYRILLYFMTTIHDTGASTVNSAKSVWWTLQLFMEVVSALVFALVVVSLLTASGQRRQSPTRDERKKPHSVDKEGKRKKESVEATKIGPLSATSVELVEPPHYPSDVDIPITNAILVSEGDDDERPNRNVSVPGMFLGPLTGNTFRNRSGGPLTENASHKSGGPADATRDRLFQKITSGPIKRSSPSTKKPRKPVARECGRERWQPDDSRDTCPICSEHFCSLRHPLGLRKHHCRVCGNLVCNNCSKYFVIPRGRHRRPPDRVCTVCQDRYTLYDI